MPREPTPDLEDDDLRETYNPLANPLNLKPVHIDGFVLISPQCTQLH